MKSVYELSFLEQPRPGEDWYTDFTDLRRFDPQPMTLFEEAGEPHDDDSEPLSRQSLVCGRSLGLRRCRVVSSAFPSPPFPSIQISPPDAVRICVWRASGFWAADFSDAHPSVEQRPAVIEGKLSGRDFPTAIVTISRCLRRIPAGYGPIRHAGSRSWESRAQCF